MRDLDCGDDACSAPGSGSPSTLSTIISLTPFILTFGGVSVLVIRNVFPQLSRVQNSRDGDDHFLPSDAPLSLQQAHAEHGAKSFRRQVAAGAFSTTIALATVLAELILCEISDLVNPYARATALKITVPTLLFFLIVIIPFLEFQSLISGSGWSFQKTATGRVPRTAWLLQFAVFGLWLFAFWSLGNLVPVGSEFMHSSHTVESPNETAGGLARACLERIGVIGISLMALLSGFASVSSPWHTFGTPTSRKPVTDADIARKQAGLDATNEMLITKRHRLQTLQRKVASEKSSAQNTGFLTKVVGSFRGSGDATEISGLKLEISGLQAMEANLSTTLSQLRSRQANSARAATPLGKLLVIPTYVFSIYCMYRIAATVVTTLRRFYLPSSSFSSSDPINRFLGLIAKHWDPKLDQIAWARQISFLLSGVILAASANSALQTFHLFAKWTPGLLYQAQANFALLIGQISAIYVISAALLMRSNLPKEVGSAVGDVLESALEPGFVDRWFEGWFLFASLVTACGIWVGRKIGELGEDWDDMGMEEMGQKRS